MRVKGKSRHQLVLDLTNPATREEAERMADLLIAEGVSDTNEIGLARWEQLLGEAIKVEEGTRAR